jgi:hypothetical protein
MSTTPSITSWTRLEPQSRSPEPTAALRASVHDPLWLLARQWQLQEFRAEDAGSPAGTELRVDTTTVTGYHPGWPDRDETLDYDPGAVPLEALVEREPIREAGPARLRLAAEAGARFLELLDAHRAGGQRAAYAGYVIDAEDARWSDLDDASRRLLGVVAGRLPDGDRLYDDLVDALGEADDQGERPGQLPDTPPIPAGARDWVRTAAVRWLAWYEHGLLGTPPEPAAAGAWDPQRLEHRFAMSATAADVDLRLVAPEFAGRRLDWPAFDLAARPTGGQASQAPPVAAVPAGVAYPGMPAPRFWEFEDARVHFGSVEAAPEDLARMLLVEFGLVFGNDWFVVPVEVAVGSACRVQALSVVDTFGRRTELRSYADVDGPDGSWHLYRLSPAEQPEGAATAAPVLFLPPVLGPDLHGPTIEELVLLRDEMANLAWAVERTVESAGGRPLDRAQASVAAKDAGPGSVPAPPGLTYRLSTTIPDFWIPLVPEVDPSGERFHRFRRGRMLAVEGGEPSPPVEPLGRLLRAPGDAPTIFEEEVPREGARVTCEYRYARWVDGSTHLWVGRRKEPGRGEASSGLGFDVLQPDLST